MLTKSCAVRVKAAGEADGLDEGVFEAIVSVFGNVDSYGDIVVAGAFAKSLAEWEASGDPIPVLWSHRMDDPDYNIGWVLEAKETAEGLWIKGQLDLENPKAVQVYRLFKGRRVTQFSFQYDIVSYSSRELDGDTIWELTELKLYEVGPTPIGANQETELLAVKHFTEEIRARQKAGRVFSAKNETTLVGVRDGLTAALADVTSLLAAVADPDEEDSKAAPSPANPEEPAGANGEEPSKETAERELKTRLISLRLETS